MYRTNLMIIAALAAVSTGAPAAQSSVPAPYVSGFVVDLGQEASAASPFVAVQDSDDEREPGPANLQEAAEIAVKRYGGRAIGAETVVHEGRTVHEIRLYNDEGSARTVRVDPATGAILE